MRLLLGLLALPILLLLCILAAYRVPLPASLSGSRDLVAAVAAGLAGAGYLLALILYLFGMLRRSARTLDPSLQPLGLSGSAYAGVGRRYAGTLEGKSIVVHYLPAFSLQPARLDVRVEAEPGVRMAVDRRRPLLDCRDCPQVDLGADLPYLVYAQNEGAARQLFADPALKAAVDRLMNAGGSPELYVQAERLWFRARPTRIVGTEIEGWLRDLARLAPPRP